MARIDIPDLYSNSTYRIYLNGEEYNLPFIEIKTPKVISRSDIQKLISDVSAPQGTTSPITNIQIEIPPVTACANILYTHVYLRAGTSTTKAINQLLFQAPSGSYSGDWSSFLSGKSGDYSVKSVSFGAQTDLTASICFNSADSWSNSYISSGSLYMSMKFMSTNATATRSSQTFPITNNLTSGTVAGLSGTTTFAMNGAKLNSTSITSTSQGSTTIGGKAAKPLLQTLVITASTTTIPAQSSGKDFTITVKISDNDKINLKNSASIKDFLIPIYRFRTKNTLAWTDWLICPLKSDGTTNVANYTFYAPVLYTNASYGSVPIVDTSSFRKLTSQPPAILDKYYLYNTASTDARFLQPKYDGTVSINEISQMINNSGLPSEYKISVYSGYPDLSNNGICDKIQIGFAVGTYITGGTSWTPSKFTPGSTSVYPTQIIEIDLDAAKIGNKPSILSNVAKSIGVSL